MKPRKMTPCSSAQDLNADEMKQAAENANQTHNKDDGKSGTEGILPGLPDIFDNEKKHQIAACEGKKQYDSCTWSYKGVNNTGICNYSDGDKKFYCSNVPTSGIGSGTGGLSPKQAACLNKKVGDFCQYRDDHDMVQSGVCVRDIMDTSAQPLHCSN